MRQPDLAPIAKVATLTLLCGALGMSSSACTSGPSERSVSTTEPPATTTFETLPPVGAFAYPIATDDIIAQISVDANGPLPLPLLTIYGDRRAISAFKGQWLQGTIADVAVQQFFAEADSLGLLDDDLVLRGRDDAGQPNIGVSLDVNGRRFQHELDLVRIERPIGIRAFLQRNAADNSFDLDTAFTPAAWINCSGDTCSVDAEQGEDFARPVLPHEDVGALAAAVGIDQP